MESKMKTLKIKKRETNSFKSSNELAQHPRHGLLHRVPRQGRRHVDLLREAARARNKRVAVLFLFCLRVKRVFF